LLATHDHRNDEHCGNAPRQTQYPRDDSADQFQTLLDCLDQQPNQTRKEGPHQNRFPSGGGELQAAFDGDRLVAERPENFMIKRDIQECGDEHGHEIEKRQVSHCAGRKSHLGACLSGAAGLRKQGMIDRLPMFGGDVGITSRAQQGWREKEQKNDRRAGKDPDGKREQQPVAADDGK